MYLGMYVYTRIHTYIGTPNRVSVGHAAKKVLKALGARQNRTHLAVFTLTIISYSQVPVIACVRTARAEESSTAEGRGQTWR